MSTPAPRTPKDDDVTTAEGSGRYDEGYGPGGHGEPQGYGPGHGGGYGGGGYGGGYGEAPPKPRNGMGTAALVLGILAILLSFSAVLGIVLGVVAIILGVKGSGRAKRGLATNRGVALGGIITGVLGLILGLVFAAVYAIGGFVFFGSGAGQGFQQCISQANGDPVAIQQCSQQFQQQVNSGQY